MPAFELNGMIAVTGIVIFCCRIIDVSLGTLRTIIIVQGRKWMAFWLGFFEVILWLIVISAVLQRIQATPVLGIFYALGFATGNMVGIELENWLALGHIILRVISKEHFQKIATQLRGKGFSVTIFHGEGNHDSVAELYIVCRRRDLKTILRMIHAIEPTAFYVTEQAALVSKLYQPVSPQAAAGRQPFFKKR
jgi:uncharacterized protein YebE (UPF0316 family)